MSEVITGEKKITLTLKEPILGGQPQLDVNITPNTDPLTALKMLYLALNAPIGALVQILGNQQSVSPDIFKKGN